MTEDSNLGSVPPDVVGFISTRDNLPLLAGLDRPVRTRVDVHKFYVHLFHEA